MSDSRLRVLVIEDQFDIQTILRITLEKSGHFSVIAATTGKDGIAQAASQKPDLIILDFSLPDMDGPEIMTAIQADSGSAHIPIIMLTARTGGLATEDCKKQGAIEVLLKPFDPRTIADQVFKLYQSTKA